MFPGHNRMGGKEEDGRMIRRREPSSPGLRATRQRAAIIGALKNADGFRSAQELHGVLRTSEGVGLSTVYRTLQALEVAGEVDALRNQDGETIYRLCDSVDHHHHMVCRSCGVSVEIENLEFEAWVELMAHRHGFSRVSHTAAIYGVCQDCGRQGEIH